MAFRIYIGFGFTKNSVAIPADIATKAREFILGKAADLFGGATLTTGTGAWRDPQGKLVLEPCYVVDLGTDDVSSVDQFAGYCRDLLAQQSVAVQRIGTEAMQFV